MNREIRELLHDEMVVKRVSKAIRELMDAGKSEEELDKDFPITQDRMEITYTSPLQFCEAALTELEKIIDERRL